jgi:uncharacterized protein
LKAALAVFLKAPRPGAVKTRLVPALGPETAAGVYRALAESVVDGTRPRSGEYERVLFFTPADARAEMEAWLPGETLLAQEGPDLGSRMCAAFEECFRRGADRVAVAGSDVPGLGSGDVVALGPALDGGYYLIAFQQPRPALFQGMAWGSASVFAATMERAAVLGLTVRVLEPRRDVDTIDDLRAEWARIRPLLTGSLAGTVEKAVGPGAAP